MTNRFDILAPYTADGNSVLTLQRWLKMIGDSVILNEPIAELVGNGMIVYVHSPSDGTLSTVTLGPGQNILSGAVIGQISVISKENIEWDNFDQVTAILEDFADQSKTGQQRKDANEALGQLLGVSDRDIFRAMSVENQNKFLQNAVDQHKAHGLSPAEVAQQLLEGLHLRAPRFTAPTSAPAFGIRGPAGPGMGGGMGGGGGVQYPQGSPMQQQQQQGYAPYQPPQHPGQQTQWPPVMPQQQVPYQPPYPPKDED